MPEPVKKVQPEAIIELVDHLPIGYVLLAFAGGVIVAALIVYYIGSTYQGEEQNDAEQ